MTDDNIDTYINVATGLSYVVAGIFMAVYESITTFPIYYASIAFVIVGLGLISVGRMQKS